MKNSVELRQELASLVSSQEAIVAKAKEEKRGLSPEEGAEMDTIQGQVVALRAELKRSEDFEENIRQRALNPGNERVPVNSDLGDGEQREKSKIFAEFRIGRAIGYVSEGRSLSGAEKEVNEIAVEEARNLNLNIPNKGFNIPASMMRASGQTVTEDSGDYGGKLVKEVSGEMLVPFIPRLTVEDLGVKVLTNLTGDYPLLSGGEFTFQNLAETAQATATKIEYDKRILKPKRTACVALISNQLLIQSSIDVENDIRGRIGQALNRRIFIDLINGSGTGANPLGLLNDDIFESAIAQGVLTRAKVLELSSEVDTAESTTEKLAFLLHKRLFGKAKLIPIDAGSGLFLVDNNGSLDGETTHRTSMIPILLGTGDVDCYPLIYGDWDAARVGFWGGMNIQADPYSNMDSNELKLVINVHRDSMASNPKAFAVNKAITLA